MTWSTQDFSTVYSAVVRIGSDVNGKTEHLVDARWASPQEARSFIERRLPVLYANTRYAGVPMEALVVPGRTNVTIGTDADGQITPVERITRDWANMDRAIVQSDGKVTGWTSEA